MATKKKNIDITTFDTPVPTPVVEEESSVPTTILGLRNIEGIPVQEERVVDINGRMYMEILTTTGTRFTLPLKEYEVKIATQPE